MLSQNGRNPSGAKEGAGGKVPHAKSPILETLEPRLLLSADGVVPDLLAPLNSSASDQVVRTDVSPAVTNDGQDDLPVVLSLFARDSDQGGAGDRVVPMVTDDGELVDEYEDSENDNASDLLRQAGTGDGPGILTDLVPPPPPAMIVESPESERPSEDTPGESILERVWDLSSFFAMDDPRAAAQALKIHVETNGLLLNATEMVLRQGADATRQEKSGVTADSLVRVFNGTEFTPGSGVESLVTDRIEALSTTAERNAEGVYILQIEEDMTIGDVIDLLEQGVKVYDTVGSRAVIVRTTVEAVATLRDRPYVRWIGDYKTEYKYSVTAEAGRGNVAFIYPLDGDTPEYRSDLDSLGVPIHGYDGIVGFYDVSLDAARFGEIAAALWWVKGIWQVVAGEPLGLNYEPDDSRQIISAFTTS